MTIACALRSTVSSTIATFSFKPVLPVSTEVNLRTRFQNHGSLRKTSASGNWHEYLGCNYGQSESSQVESINSTPSMKLRGGKSDLTNEKIDVRVKVPKKRLRNTKDAAVRQNKDLVLTSEGKSGRSSVCKRVKVEDGADAAPALTVARGGSQPWQCPQELKQSGWGTFRVGTSGYVYKHWKKVVYEEGISQKQWFQLYTRLFDSVEINNSFYRLPAPQVFEGWRDQAPSGFCHSLKFSRYGTHMKRLKEPEGPINLFLERASLLGCSLLGPILVQLPPKFDLNLERLKNFLEQAPRQFRWAIEFRDTRWLVDDVYALLRAHNASLVIHDHEDIPSLHPQVVTADWVYLRFHGRNYQERYSLEKLQKHAVWIQQHLQEGHDVFAYFNNDMNAHAVYNALELRDLVLDCSAQVKV